MPAANPSASFSTHEIQTRPNRSRRENNLYKQNGAIGYNQAFARTGLGKIRIRADLDNLSNDHADCGIDCKDHPVELLRRFGCLGTATWGNGFPKRLASAGLSRPFTAPTTVLTTSSYDESAPTLLTRVQAQSFPERSALKTLTEVK